MMPEPFLSPAAPPAVGTPPFTPEPPAPLTPETHTIGLPDASDQELMQYRSMAPDPNQAYLLVRIAKIWKQVMREYKLFDGNSKNEAMLTTEHDKYMMGMAEQDPIATNKEARDEYLKRVMQMVTGSKEKSRVVRGAKEY